MSIDTKYLFVIFPAIFLSLLGAVVLTIGTVNAFENTTEGAKEQIEEMVSGTQSAATNVTEGAENATEGAD